MKSENLNFLEPSGPLQACNGTALPFIHEKCRLILASLAPNLMYKQTTVKVSNINNYEAPFTGFHSLLLILLPVNWQTGKKNLIMDCLSLFM